MLCKYLKKLQSNASMCKTGVAFEMNRKRSLSPLFTNRITLWCTEIRTTFLAANGVGYVSKCYMIYITSYCRKNVMSCVMMFLSLNCNSPFSVTFALLAPQEPQKNKA